MRCRLIPPITVRSRIGVLSHKHVHTRGNGMQEPANDGSAAEECRLDSWKEIAAYLKRDVTTVQRWEKREGMPVHRHLHDKGGSVYALTEELDAWIQSRKPRRDEPEKEPEAELPPAAPSGHGALAAHSSRLWFALAAVLCLCLAAAAWLVFQHRATVKVEPKIR